MTNTAWFLITVYHLWLYSSLLWCRCFYRTQVLRLQENKPELIIYLLKLIKRAGQIIVEMCVAFKRLNRVLITYLMFKRYWEETNGRRQTGCSSILRLWCTNHQHRLQTTSLAPETSVILYLYLVTEICNAPLWIDPHKTRFQHFINNNPGNHINHYFNINSVQF